MHYINALYQYISMHYINALYQCIISMHYINALYQCIIPTHINALYQCITTESLHANRTSLFMMSQLKDCLLTSIVHESF